MALRTRADRRRRRGPRGRLRRGAAARAPWSPTAAARAASRRRRAAAPRCPWRAASPRCEAWSRPSRTARWRGRRRSSRSWQSAKRRWMPPASREGERAASSRVRWKARDTASAWSSVKTRAALSSTSASSRRSLSSSAAAPALRRDRREQVPGGHALSASLGQVLGDLAKGGQLRFAGAGHPTSGLTTTAAGPRKTRSLETTRYDTARRSAPVSGQV